MIVEGKVRSEEELARVRAERRKNQKLAQLKAFHLNITPEKYRGMRLLGNFRPADRRTLDDHRLAYLSHSLFLNKAVLDVGAGDGALTLEIAVRMLPQRIVALDIDAEMLGACKRRADRLVQNSEKYSAVSRNQELQKTVAQLPLYFQQLASRAENAHLVKPEGFLEVLPSGLAVLEEFPRNFYLLNENFFNLEANEQYDTVVCLGTVKWVHLALGDKGLQALFAKAHDCLRPGGHFVVEWAHAPSYRRKKGLSDLYRENLRHNMKIEPPSFPALLKFSGFELVSEAAATADRPLKHPLQVYAKAHSPQSLQ